jgi:macrolide-specific efflux system membrane fusion protein
MLTEVKVKEGHSVAKGDMMAEIDTRGTRAKMQIAESEYYAAEAQANNGAELEVAIKSEEVAKASLDQIDDVIRKNDKAISTLERRKYYFEHEKAKAQIKQATNEKEIHRLQAKSKHAQLDAANIELDMRQVRAPFNGQVVDVMKKVGDWVTVGEPIMHIVGLDRMRVEGFVLTNDASYEELLGKPVTITVQSAGGSDRTHVAKGIINFASPLIGGVGSSRRIKVLAEFDNEKATDPVTKQEFWKIQPGSMASMAIDLTPKSAPVSAPAKGTKVQSFKPVTGSASRER